MNQTLVLGNIITMDEKRPYAKAAVVRDGVFTFIGEAEEAKKLAGADANVLDYGDNFIYPGFLEAHSHGYFAGYREVGQANFSHILETDYGRYREILEDFIKKHPEKDVYLAAGWIENEIYVDRTDLDEVCPEKPVVMQSGGGHSMLLNTKALEWAGIDAEYAKKYGYDQVYKSFMLEEEDLVRVVLQKLLVILSGGDCVLYEGVAELTVIGK